MVKANKTAQLDDLKRLIDDIEKVRIKERMSSKFKSWHRETLETLERVFDRKSRQVKDFEAIRYNLAAFSNKTPESKFEEAFQHGLMSAAVMLSAAVKDLQLGNTTNPASAAAPVKAPEPVVKVPAPAPSNPEPAAPVKSVSSPVAPSIAREPPAIVKRAMAASSNKIFIVYANDIGMKDDVSSFLSKVGLSTVVLKDSAGSNSSLIDELDKHDNAPYAIVMLNPDASGIAGNTVYELGMIVGRLGRNRVCALVKKNIDILADYSGISYVPVDSPGAWKFLLIKQLKDAGFNIDANLAL
ncbi:MAG: nucleotide-binding protein [Gammaproteobacteria bacterium]|nr:nucleotide-binding protein [Gammaproteobacteria bacterium]